MPPYWGTPSLSHQLPVAAVLIITVGVVVVVVVKVVVTVLVVVVTRTVVDIVVAVVQEVTSKAAAIKTPKTNRITLDFTFRLI